MDAFRLKIGKWLPAVSKEKSLNSFSKETEGTQA